ncbi:uncharacterized protein METZ01_LOCUS92978 [marine metagenome]|uniref:Uncharacterized protein n=1 Tax=marine metagenome TaxID=408172 RepID=A0A381VIU7_9ZZZZ
MAPSVQFIFSDRGHLLVQGYIFAGSISRYSYQFTDDNHKKIPSHQNFQSL